MQNEYAIIGGGVVGLSVAYGLLSLGKQVRIFDQGDDAVRASRGNFGLVWVQGKGINQPAYARWSKQSAHLWRPFADELCEQTGHNLSLVQQGGYRYFTDEAALEQHTEKLKNLQAALDIDYPFEVLGHNALRHEEPNIGPGVVGATFHHSDGHVNPLLLLKSLAQTVRMRGGQIQISTDIGKIEAVSDGFEIHDASGSLYSAEKVVLCAGLGSVALGRLLGFKAPVRPQRGQVLITEKLPFVMNRPSDEIRQIENGSVQIGASAEEVGMDDRDSLEVTAQLAHHAATLFPSLSDANIVRHWSALRIMSPDGLPVYQQSKKYPGAFFITCHSGITLAAAHARLLPVWISGAENAPQLDVFSEDRFDD